MNIELEVEKYLKLKQDLEQLEAKLKSQKEIIASLNGKEFMLDGIRSVIKVSTTTRYTVNDNAIDKLLSMDLDVFKKSVDMDKLKKVANISNDLGYVPSVYTIRCIDDLKKVINLSDFCKSSSYDVIRFNKIDA